MRHLILLCCSLLPSFSTLAQKTTVSGQVLELKGDIGAKDVELAGATVIQTGTTNGTGCDEEGNFKLTIPGTSDSISLTVSSIGYVRQQLRVAAGSRTTIRLAVDNRLTICTVIISPILTVGLTSGIQYAPYGGSLKLYGRRFMRRPLTATVGYQTNFSRNYALTASLELPALWQRRFTVLETLDYQQLQAIPANVHFQSYTGTVSIGSFRTIGPLPWITFLVGGGYAHYRSLAATEAVSTSGFGYSLGLQNNYYFHPFRLTGTVQATRWPSYWQWQAQLVHPFGRSFRTGLTFNHLRYYSELSILLSRDFFSPFTDATKTESPAKWPGFLFF